MATRYTSTIDKTGPFFTYQPGKTFRQNARSMMRSVAVEGAQDVIAQLGQGESARAPISSGVQPARISGHVTPSVPYTPDKVKDGRIISNVYVPNWGYTPKQGRALMAAYSRVAHATGAFKRTAGRLRSAKKVNAEYLLRNIQ